MDRDEGRKRQLQDAVAGVVEAARKLSGIGRLVAHGAACASSHSGQLRRHAGESVDVSAFLDHSSLAVTTVYLPRLEGVEDRALGQVAIAIGV